MKDGFTNRGTFGDLATGDGFLGEIVDLPGGSVGLALFNEHGWERRVVYVPADRIKIVKLAQDRPRAQDLRDYEFGQLTAAHTIEQAQKPPEQGW